MIRNRSTLFLLLLSEIKTSKTVDLNKMTSVNGEENTQREESKRSVQNISFDGFNKKFCSFVGKASQSIDEAKTKMNKVISASTVAKNTFQSSLQAQNENNACEERVECQLNEDDDLHRIFTPDTILDNVMEKAFKIGVHAVVFIEYAACKSKKILHAADEARETFVKEMNKVDTEEECENLRPENFGKPKVIPVKRNEETNEYEKKEVGEAKLEPPPGDSS